MKTRMHLAWMMVIGFQTPAHAKVLQIASGGRHTCALIDNGKVKCWGQNGGFLGIGDNANRGNGEIGSSMGPTLPDLNFGTSERVLKLAAGSSSTCALFESGRLKCWGGNQDGQLGMGSGEGVVGNKANDMGEKLSFLSLGDGLKVSDVFLGDRTSCAIFTTGQLKCWGFNDGDGELGTGDAARRGNNPESMGNNLPFVNLGTNVKAVRGATGVFHTCVITDLGKVKCFGYNNFGQLGLGNNGSRGANPGQMGDDLPYLNLGTESPATLVASSNSSACVVFADNQVKCWGDNSQGQLGFDRPNAGGNADDMGTKLPFVNLGTTEKIIQIISGEASFCVLYQSGKAKCWGLNNGRLGIGDTANRGAVPRLMGMNLPYLNVGRGIKIKSLAMGASHTCGLLSFGGLIKCWGENAEGQLGYGDTQTRGVRSDEMGDDLPFVDIGD